MSLVLEAYRDLLRGMLIGVIRLYRRHLSGRWLLRHVTCTFGSTESCSAHGIRMAQTAPSLMAALLAIVSRLRRCRRASLYRVTPGCDILWDELYDNLDLECFSRELDNELLETRAALVWAAMVVATRRGDSPGARRQLAALAPKPSSQDALLAIRSDAVLRRRPGRALRWSMLAVLLICVPPMGALWQSPWLIAPIVALCLGILSTFRAYFRQRAKVEALIDAVELLGFRGNSS